jgi:hypothetical protein
MAMAAIWSGLRRLIAIAVMDGLTAKLGAAARGIGGPIGRAPFLSLCA